MALTAGAVLVLAACGGGDGGAGGGEEPAAVWEANCAACHGPQGEGTTVGPPLVHETYEPGHHGDESFRRAMQQGSIAHHWGFGDMPPQPQLADDEIDAVIAYVRGLQREAGIIP
jgi:cytochrome c